MSPDANRNGTAKHARIDVEEIDDEPTSVKAARVIKRWHVIVSGAAVVLGVLAGGYRWTLTRASEESVSRVSRRVDRVEERQTASEHSAELEQQKHDAELRDIYKQLFSINNNLGELRGALRMRHGAQ